MSRTGDWPKDLTSLAEAMQNPEFARGASHKLAAVIFGALLRVAPLVVLLAVGLWRGLLWAIPAYLAALIFSKLWRLKVEGTHPSWGEQGALAIDGTWRIGHRERRTALVSAGTFFACLADSSHHVSEVVGRRASRNCRLDRKYSGRKNTKLANG